MNMAFMIPQGISFAASSLVGNQIGKNCKEQAQRYAICSILLSVLCAVPIMAFFWLAPRSIALFFTKDEDTVVMVVETFSVLIYYEL